LAIGAADDPGRFSAFDVPVIADAGSPAIENHAGPLAGILGGLDWAAALGGDHLATFAVDAPFFPDDLVARLGEGAVSPDMISVAASGGRAHYVLGLWPTTLAGDLRKFLESGADRSVRKFLENHDVVEVDFSASPIDPFFNINKPDDWATAEQMVRDRP
jgi:molybdopterin-guanine dinucleotide biosynthesis protein A